MQTFNSFNELAVIGQFTENDGFDVTSNPNGTTSGGGKVPPPAPTTQVAGRNPQQEQGGWGWTQQREWNAKAENAIKELRTEMRQGFAEIGEKAVTGEMLHAGLNSLEQRLTALITGQQPSSQPQNPPSTPVAG